MKVRAMNVSAMHVSALDVSAGHVSARHVSAARAFGLRRLPVLTFTLALTVFASSGAWAQMGGGSGPVGTTGHAGRVQDVPEKPPEPAPDAIPGAKASIPAAPALHPAGDMQPTDALFDAINRGDIASAREALSRGADLNGVNILGMTPMELSVDLGRNDISFLLLSMRGEDGNRGARALGRDAAPDNKAAQSGKPAGKVMTAKTPAGKAAAAKTRTGKVVAARAPTGKVTASNGTPGAEAVKTVATPKLFANDGGTPLPSAGFLGFDSHAAAN
jgi:hypothetical protein